ncbi:RNA 3'-terminal phosphate cyclase [Paracidovorax cattleyae]|uniref:RNA 3'-terminal phosphate cyclase n=2 Tax=Paracidovorax cattleyae TaxID=80868 RepID=A0A1H0TI30_9BURK|nr:RNA 3'-terminal phosphate cyclase [Paracidovorax cattleyae]SDP53491.1 RNA 3'-terminal phosphate cyclase [Paracidovorax cattleyae]
MATLAYGQVTEVFTQFGVKGTSAEEVARELAHDVQAYLASDAALGPLLADQWALPLALAVWQRQRGAAYTCTELTTHATTHFDVIERILPVRFAVEGTGSHWTVRAQPR